MMQVCTAYNMQDAKSKMMQVCTAYNMQDAKGKGALLCCSAKEDDVVSLSMQVTIVVIIKPMQKGHHCCDYQTISKMASYCDHQMQNITNIRSVRHHQAEQTYAIMKGKIMQLGIMNHVFMFQSKHISFSGKRGEKTWSNRSCFSQV